eukprot:gene4604-4814_t
MCWNLFDLKLANNSLQSLNSLGAMAALAYLKHLSVHGNPFWMHASVMEKLEDIDADSQRRGSLSPAQSFASSHHGNYASMLGREAEDESWHWNSVQAPKEERSPEGTLRLMLLLLLPQISCLEGVRVTSEEKVEAVNSFTRADEQARRMIEEQVFSAFKPSSSTSGGSEESDEDWLPRW